MQKPLTVLLVASLLLAGCGGWRDSRINPTNWFGNSRSQPVEAAAADDANPLVPSRRRGVFSRTPRADISVPIATISELRVEPTADGAIVYAAGIATRQGPYQVELRPVTTDEEAENGVMSFSFRVVYPEDATPVGTELSRTVHVAHSLSRQEIRNVRMVRVAGRENLREVRRR